MISVSRTMIPQQHFANISGKQKLVQPWVSTTQAKYKKKRKKKYYTNYWDAKNVLTKWILLFPIICQHNRKDAFKY